MGFFTRITEGLKKTRESMMRRLDEVAASFGKIDQELFDEIEEVLILADVGVATSQKIVEELKAAVKEKAIADPAQVKGELRQIVSRMLEGGEEMHLSTKPSIVLVIGVNGVGKTTTIGKMASYYVSQGKKVILGAADTFRATRYLRVSSRCGLTGPAWILSSTGKGPTRGGGL